MISRKRDDVVGESESVLSLVITFNDVFSLPSWLEIPNGVDWNRQWLSRLSETLRGNWISKINFYYFFSFFANTYSLPFLKDESFCLYFFKLFIQQKSGEIIKLELEKPIFITKFFPTIFQACISQANPGFVVWGSSKGEWLNRNTDLFSCQKWCVLAISFLSDKIALVWLEKRVA